VPEPSRAVATVPVDRLLAFRLFTVLLDPLIVLFVRVWVASVKTTSPLPSGSTTVRSLFESGDSIVKVPDPRGLLFSANFDNLFILKELWTLTTYSVAFRLHSLKTKHYIFPIVVPAFSFGEQAKFCAVLVRHRD